MLNVTNMIDIISLFSKVLIMTIGPYFLWLQP